MAIFSRKGDLKKVEALPDEDTAAETDFRAGRQLREDVREDVREAGREAGTEGGTENSPPPDAASHSAAAAPAESGAASVGDGTAPSIAVTVAPPTTSESVDIEPVDIEPVDIDVPPPGDIPLAFGIGDAIRLMRSLPADPNMDLVVRVVRVTLGAVNVSVEEIMADAVRKEGQIQESITALETQVAELEKQLYTRRCEIAAHEADLKETASVRERLHLADKYTGPRPPPPPADATRIVHPKPSEWAAEWEKSEQAKRG